MPTNNEHPDSHQPEAAADILDKVTEEEEDEDEDIIVLKDETGVEHEFQVEFMLDREIDDHQYLIVTEADSDEGEAIALRLQGEELVVVDDDATLEKINTYLNQE